VQLQLGIFGALVSWTECNKNLNSPVNGRCRQGAQQ